MSKLIDHEQETTFITLTAPAFLVLVKGGKAAKAAVTGDEADDLLTDDEHADEDTPEKALERAHATH